MQKRSRYVRGVVWVAGIALLVGVLGTPVPTAAISTGERIGKGVCYFLTLGTCYFIWTPGSFGTNSPPEPLRCTPARFVAPPTFLTGPVMSVKYRFHGSCSRADLPNAPALNYRMEGSWTPGETHPNRPNASESIEITGYEPYMLDRAPGGRIFMYWTARCNREPWLSPDTASCQRLGAFIPDDLRETAPELQTTIFPKTREAIPANARQQFYAQYLRLTSSAATKINPGAISPVKDDMFSIIRPVNNDRIPRDQLVITVQPPKLGIPRVTDLEFTWLDAPPTQPFVNHHAVETALLLRAQGYLVPPQVARFAGRWQVRAASVGDAGPGAWSLPVQFKLFLTQPTQSQQQAPAPSPVQQTAPLPGSSVTQPSHIQQTSPLPSSSVTQAPPPSTAPVQMNRSSSMFTTRGVEEKGGKKGSETVDTSPGLEKNP